MYNSYAHVHACMYVVCVCLCTGACAHACAYKDQRSTSQELFPLFFETESPSVACSAAASPLTDSPVPASPALGFQMTINVPFM